VTGYRIYRWDNVSSSVLLGTVTGTSFEVPLLTTDTAAAYNVRASDAAGNLSIASNSVPPNPTGPPPIVACRVTYTTVAQWRGGFVATLKIANSGTTPIDAWQLDFYFGGDQQVTSAWNATASQSFTDVTMLSLDRNGAIAPQGSRTVGMVGTWHTSDAPPYLYILNGAHCVID
jgi:cellulase/cellobiase CelA1